MTKDEYIKMLYQRTEYLKSEIADFENCNGGVEQARLWDIKEQVSCIFGLIDECDEDLFPYTIRCANTNEEWRKTCSTEELAEAMTKVVLNIVAWNNDPKPSEVRNILKAWLKQPHKPIS